MSDELPKGWVLSTSAWYSNAMKRATAIFLIAASVLVANSALAKLTQPKVTFVSECS